MRYFDIEHYFIFQGVYRGEGLTKSRGGTKLKTEHVKQPGK